MNGDEIGFGEVSDVHRNERRSKVLTKLPANFYDKAEAHLQALRDECRAAGPDPANPKTMMLQDQISKVDKRLRQIYDMRERKITLAALDGMLGAPQPDNMTKADKALYDRLVEVLSAFRQGKALPASPECVPAAQPVPKECHAPAAPQPAAQPAPAPTVAAAAAEPKESEAPAAAESMMVQVLEDIPTFVGVNVTYDLRKDDVVTLPSQFANLLSSRGKVRIVGA